MEFYQSLVFNYNKINLGFCYHISSEELSWSDAHAACLSMSEGYYNSDLASIHSATEMEFIKSKF